jgi:hypothetical protein
MVKVGMRTSSRRRALVAAVSTLLVTVVMTACSGAADAEGTWVVEFPSVDALLVTESIDVDVFDAASDSTSCITLSERVRTSQELPSSLTSLSRVDPCSLDHGDGSLRLSNGERVLLVRANRDGRPYLVGCSRFTASPGFVANVTVSLLAGVAAPPPPGCASMEARCQGAKC